MGFLDKLGNSKYLKKEDATPTPLLLTIKHAQEEDVAMEGQPEKLKTVLYFNETQKGFVLGMTTGQQIASFLGDPGNDPTPWYGKKIVLYNDPNVTMKGKIVGGLRVRAPRGQAAAPLLQPLQSRQQPATMQQRVQQQVQQQVPPPPPDEGDDVPF